MTPINIDRIVECASKATPGPWRSRGLGGDSIILTPTHKWHRPYVIPEHGYPLALPRTYEDRDGKTCVDHSSAGFAHDDAQYIAACSPETILALCEAVKAAMEFMGHNDSGIETGCPACDAFTESLLPFGGE